MWKQAYLETRVLSADPMELICLLYQHAIDSVREARRSIAKRDIAARSKAISKALAILGELNSSLDHTAGGAISGNLEQLYIYMTQKLTEANLQQREAPLAEVESLLVTLGEAFHQTQSRNSAAQRPAAEAPANAWQGSESEAAAHAWSA